MIINNTFGFIFVHVPKCAGTTMTNLLSRCSTYNDIEVGGTAMGETIAPYFRERFSLTKHSTAMEIRRVTGDDLWRRYFSFAVVRNPYDRAYSAYKFLQRMRVKNSFLLFPDFVKSDYFLSEGLNRVLMPQLFWIRKNANDTQIGVDYVGRVESIDQTVQQLAIRVPKLSNHFDNIAIPQLNRRSDYGAENLIDLLQDKGVESRIFEKYKIDFETFGYARINNSRLIANRHVHQENGLRQQVVLKKKDTAICITGMHRSGTSMVARLLNMCGLYLGEKKALMPPNRENPEGFWEHMSFVGLNDEILPKLEAGWDFPPKLSVNWHLSPNFDFCRKKAAAITQSLEQHAPWGWKDPRNCLTIDFWKSLIPDLKVIICIRNPQEVVKSLHKRGVSSNAFGFNLWLKYNQTILGSVDPKRCIVTHYESYFDDPIGELKRLLNFIGLSASEEQLRTASETIQVSLRRNNALKHELPQDVQNLYKRLYQKASPMLMKNIKKTDLLVATQVLEKSPKEKSSAPLEKSSAERDGDVQNGVDGKTYETDLSKCCLGLKAPKISTLGNDHKSSDVSDHVKSGHSKSISEKGANNNAPLVSLIIPVFNNVELTKKCIDSIRKNTRCDLYEIIIVDNASTDATLEYLNSLEDSVKIIRNEKNVGFAKACNLGARISESDYLLFLNNDTEAKPSWLEYLLSVFNQNLEVAIAGAKLLYPDRTIQHAGIEFLPLQHPLNLNEFGAVNVMPDHPYRFLDETMPLVNVRRELDMITGACLLIKSSVFKEVGGFDEVYLNGCEDIDLCLKIRQRGLKVIYEPKAILIHHEGKTSGRFDHVKKNLEIFFSRWAAHFDENWRFVGCKNPSVRTQKSITNNKRIKWEGSQLVGHSLALVNRELCLQLIDAGYELCIIPYEKNNINPQNDARFEKIVQKTNKTLSGAADVHVRHQWPPQFTPPPNGHWVIIQPWEFGSIPKDWVRQMSLYVDEVWVPSHYVRDCYVRSGVPAEKVFVVPNGVNTDIFDPESSPYLLKTTKKFKFLFVGGTIYRKGIDTLLDVYVKTFSSCDDVCLVIKDMGGHTFYKGQTAKECISRYQADPNNPEIEYIDKILSEPEIAGLYTACDCLVHPYRGEGFGLPIAEAMASELPVIVTGYGAALDFCTPENSYLLPAKEIRFLENKVGELETVDYPWLAEPDRESLAAMMKRVIAFPLEAKEKAKAARAAIERDLTWEKAASAVIRRVSEIVLKPIVRFRYAAEAQQTPSTPKVSIIIRVSTGLKNLQKCIQNLKKFTHEPHEVIFVVNGDNAKALNWVKRNAEENENCRYIENKDGYGWSKEINHGIRGSSGDHILTLDYRSVVSENWLSDLLECMEHGLKPGIVGSMPQGIYDRSGHHKKYFEALLKEVGNVSSFRERNRHRRIPVRAINAPCLLFRRGLVNEIGLMDERFDDRRFGVEDFCLRASLAGYQNAIAGDVWISCDVQEKSAENYEERERTNKRIFKEKWHSPETQQSFGRKLFIYDATVKADEMFSKGQIEMAAASMLEAIEKDPGDSNLYIKLSEMLIDAKNFDDARGILDSLPHAVNDSKRLSLLACCEEGVGRDDKAQEHAACALAIDPSMALALNVKGIIAYKRGEREAAEKFFNRAIEAAPSFGDSYTNLGSMKWAAGEQENALDLFERGFILAPTVSDVAFAYHTAVVETQSFSRIETVLAEACALHPNDRRIAFIRIAMLIQQEKNEEAMDAIEKALLTFSIDDGMLSAAQKVRNRIGPMSIQTTNTQKSLSVCMIVKNEETHLVRCLDSIKPIADEIIVVDTGSTDRTRDIARVLGAKVFDYAWADDFSEARNFSLSKAEGDWILIIDADEVIASQDYAALRKMIVHSKKKTAYIMITRNYTTAAGNRGWRENEGQYDSIEAGLGWIPSPKVRLFPNNRNVRFSNPVHELVEPSLKKNDFTIQLSKIPIHHYGKLDRTKVVEKGKKYYELGIKKLESHKNDHRALTELAIQASELGEHEEAIRIWKRVIEIKPNDGVAHMSLGSAYLMLKKYDDASNFSLKALQIDPHLREAALNFSVAEMIVGDLAVAKEYLLKIIEKDSEYPPAIARLSAIYLILGLNDEGKKALARIQQKGYSSSYTIEKQASELVDAGKTDNANKLILNAKEIGIESKKLEDILSACQTEKILEIPRLQHTEIQIESEECRL
jgi:GT2 family glycosyltransferase/glycosyltransferase involved in cell wall biosynthesis/Tfp pilus assembly protein PilF